MNHLYQFNDYGSFQFAKAQLLAHALSLLPEKDNRKHAVKGVDHGIQIGFNAAIDLMEQSLREGYE